MVSKAARHHNTQKIQKELSFFFKRVKNKQCRHFRPNCLLPDNAKTAMIHKNLENGRRNLSTSVLITSFYMAVDCDVPHKTVSMNLWFWRLRSTELDENSFFSACQPIERAAPHPHRLAKTRWEGPRSECDGIWLGQKLDREWFEASLKLEYFINCG